MVVEMKVQIRIPIWPGQLPDLAKFLYVLRHIHACYMDAVLVFSSLMYAKFKHDLVSCYILQNH